MVGSSHGADVFAYGFEVVAKMGNVVENFAVGRGNGADDDAGCAVFCTVCPVCAAVRAVMVDVFIQ